MGWIRGVWAAYPTFSSGCVARWCGVGRERWKDRRPLWPVWAGERRTTKGVSAVAGTLRAVSGPCTMRQIRARPDDLSPDAGSVPSVRQISREDSDLALWAIRFSTPGSGTARLRRPVEAGTRRHDPAAADGMPAMERERERERESRGWIAPGTRPPVRRERVLAAPAGPGHTSACRQALGAHPSYTRVSPQTPSRTRTHR
jgi:hypothetical protein